MATYIKTLKEDNGDITYPQTKGSAVLLNNGSDLETELSQYVTAEDIASTSALTPPVQTSMIADGAVTAAKINTSDFPFATAYTDTKTSSFSGVVPYNAFKENNGFTLSGGALVAPKTGYYLISASIAGHGTGGWLRVHVSSSTSSSAASTMVSSAINRMASASYHSVVAPTVVAHVTAGQYIYARQSDSGNYNLNDGMDAGVMGSVIMARFIGE